MGPIATAGLAKAGGTALKWGLNRWMLNRNKNFDRTLYAQHLKKIQEQGLYPSSVRGSAINEMSRTTAPAARKSRTELLGRLQAQGMGNSIAGNRALAEPGMRQAGQVGSYAAQFARMNAETKAQAADEYGRAKGSYTERYKQLMQQNDMQAMGELVDIGTNAAISGLGKQGAFKDFDFTQPKTWENFIQNYPDGPEKGAQVINTLMQAKYYGDRGELTEDRLMKMLEGMGEDEAYQYLQLLKAQGLLR